MKWKTAKHGDIRTRRIFAIIPRDCDDGFTRCLMFLWVAETYEDLGTYQHWLETGAWV
jgi:hypothetical protein